MKNRRLINAILLIMAIGIAIIIARDFVANRGGKNIDNPYEFDVSEYTKVDPSEIIYQEEKILRLNVNTPKGIDFYSGEIYVIADSSVLKMNVNGQLLQEIKLNDTPTAINVNGQIWLAFKNQIARLDENGKELQHWPDFGPRSVITSLAVSPKFVYVADAGNRLVYQYTYDGELIRKIGAKDEQKAVPGFIIPSPYFDIDLNEDGYLWAVDPGRHSLENFNADGSLRTSWAVSSVKTEGFSGCCNPAHMAIIDEHQFVTSEKGIARVKIYDQHGEYVGVVAAPDQFDEASHAPDVCATDDGRVILLDFTRKQVRLFKPKENK